MRRVAFCDPCMLSYKSWQYESDHTLPDRTIPCHTTSVGITNIMSCSVVSYSYRDNAYTQNYHTIFPNEIEAKNTEVSKVDAYLFSLHLAFLLIAEITLFTQDSRSAFTSLSHILTTVHPDDSSSDVTRWSRSMLPSILSRQN